MMAAEPSTDNSADVFASTEPQPVRRFLLLPFSFLCLSIGGTKVIFVVTLARALSFLFFQV
jgi:hypothetical protein